MNKRSAMMVAAGLVLSMVVAGMAIASGFTGPEASASGGVSTDEIRQREPKVRTITETITVHRDAKPSDDGSAPAPVVITQAPPAPAASGATSSFDDDGYDDDEYEDEDGEDHEDEDHGDDEDHEDAEDHEDD